MITFYFGSWQWVNIGQYLISIVFVLGIYFTAQTAEFSLEKEMTWEVLSFSRSETSGRYKVLPVGVAIRCIRPPTPRPKKKDPLTNQYHCGWILQIFKTNMKLYFRSLLRQAGKSQNWLSCHTEDHTWTSVRISRSTTLVSVNLASQY